jgi:hypothetical protein
MTVAPAAASDGCTALNSAALGALDAFVDAVLARQLVRLLQPEQALRQQVLVLARLQPVRLPSTRVDRCSPKHLRV